MPAGAAVAFRVTATTFTRVSQLKRGRQATTTTSEAARAAAPSPVRVRSESVDLAAADPLPAAMEVLGALDGPGLGPDGWG